MEFSPLLQKYKDRTAAVIPEGRKLSYGEIAGFSAMIGKAIPERCLVFSLCQNTVGSLCGYISFLNNRIVPLMLESGMDLGLLENLVSIYHPSYLWIPVERVAEFPGAEIVLEQEQYALVRLAEKKTPFLLAENLALLLTTSGSTGSPKLVRLSYDNILANAESIATYLSIDDHERPVTALPMSYSFGLSIINSHMLMGATLLLTPRSIMEREFWTFFRGMEATSFSGVPYTYEILKKLNFFRMELPALQTMTQAGGKISHELQREFGDYARQHNKRFFVMYGQTEATARMSYLDHSNVLEKIGSMGRAIPGGEFWIINDDNKIIAEPDVTGELVYRGRNVSLGYAERGEDLNNEDENKGILYTGDMARRDSDGFYYIVGRKKRFIKVFGNRVNLDEMERLLKGLAPDCACVGTDDHLVVYITDGALESSITDYIIHTTGINKVALRVRTIAEIPKNSSGKTIYSNLDAN